MKTGQRRGWRSRLSVCLLAAALLLTQLSSVTAYADAVSIPEEKRLVLTLGADLSEEQKEYIRQYFGISGQEINTIVITNQDERDHLSGKIPDEQIGTHTLSCALIRVMDTGGIQVKTANMNYVTSETIASTLSTSGVYNCEVLTAAPFEVSGTGALTGCMMAYEAATGLELDEDMVDLANDELILTGELAGDVGQDQAALVVNDIKIHIVRDQLVEEEEVRSAVYEVVETAQNAFAQIGAGSPLGEVHTEKLVDFGMRYSQIGYNYSDLQRTLERVTHNVTQKAGIKDPIEDTFETLDEDSSLDPDSILLGTQDEVLGEGAIINSTNSAALGEHEAEPIEVYTGEVSVTSAGGVKADGFISGTNLISYRDLNSSYALMDLNGNIVSESLYQNSFRGENGYIRARLNDSTGYHGILGSDGAVAVPFQYQALEIPGTKWAVGITLADATADDYDYSDSGNYYVIDRADVYYLESGSAEPVASMTRDQYRESNAQGDYVNIRDASGTITTYDSGMNALCTTDSMSDFGDYNEDRNVMTLIEDATGYYVSRFLGSYAEISDYSSSLEGITDRYGNAIIPPSFDDIIPTYSYDSYMGHGYFGAEKDGKFVYVTAGGNVTGSFDVPADEVKNFGMSALYGAPDGSQYLMSGDGVMTNLGSDYSEIRGIRESKGMFWKAQDASGKYDLIDWHGNVLVSGSDGYSVSANGNYLISQDGYTSSTLYLVNDASPVSISGTAGGASEKEAEIVEGASMEAYTGEPVIARAGTLEADGFIDGTDLLYATSDSGAKAVLDMNGNALTEPLYGYLSSSRGWVTASDYETGLSGLLTKEGQVVLPCEYEKISILSDRWAVAYRLKEGGTEEDSDFFTSDHYYLIDEAKVCYVVDGEVTSVVLTRDQIADIGAKDEYVNIQDRTTGVVTTYDSTFNPVASANSVYSFELTGTDVQIKKIRESTGWSALDSEFMDGYIRMADYSTDPVKEGIVDMNGSVIIPVEYDDVISYYNGGSTRYWANGYFAVEKDGMCGFVTADGQVTCELKYPADSFQSAGMSARVENSDGTYMIVAADGTESGPYDHIGYSQMGKFWEVRRTADSGYELVDWHGTTLLEGYSDISFSSDDSYVLVEEAYGEPQVLYAVDGAAVEGSAQVQAPAAETEAQPEPAPEQQSETAPAEENGTQDGQTGETGENDPMAAVKSVLEKASELAAADLPGNTAAITDLIKTAGVMLGEDYPAAKAVLDSAVTLLEGGTADAGSIATLISTALGTL